MTDTPTTPAAPGKIASTVQGFVDGIAWLISFIPQSWRKYVAVVLVGAGTVLGALWFMYSQLEWKVPSWSAAADCQKIQSKLVQTVPIGPSIADFETLESRVKALESSKIVTQALPLVSAPDPKQPKRITGHVRNSNGGVLTP